MEIKNDIIVGISLGTRCIGFAILINNEISDYWMKKYNGVWSEKKQDKVLTYIEKLIESEKIDGIALKLPNKSHQGKALLGLVKKVKTMAMKCQISYCEYNVKAIKQHYGATKKRMLMRLMAEQHSCLQPYYEREIKNRFAYHVRLFEAVGVAVLCRNKKQ